MKTVVVLCAEWGQLYPHTADLLALEFCRSADPWPSPQLSEVHTPLNPAAWETALASHPDRAFARYILKGIREGFRIGFNRTCPLRSAHRNMPSARLHPEVVQAYLDKERAAGRMLGPFTPGDTASLTHQPLRGDTKGPQYRQVAPDYRPVAPTRVKCE